MLKTLFESTVYTGEFTFPDRVEKAEFYSEIILQAEFETVRERIIEAGSVLPTFYFNYGDATPANVYLADTDRLIKTVTLVILTAFNGVGAAVSIGTQAEPTLLMDVDDNNPALVGSFETSPNETIVSGTQLKVFITPGAGATQGRAAILLEYATA